MKSTKLKINFLIIFLLGIVLLFSLFGISSLTNKVIEAETSSNTVSIEDCDDYIDYLKGNSGDGLNQYIVAIYDVFVSNLDAIKTGSFKISLSSQKELKNFATLTDEDRYVIWSGAANALKYDIPELFFIDFTQIEFSYDLNWLGSKTYYLESSNCYIKGIYSQNQLESMLNQLEEKRQEVYSNISEDWTDYQKIYYINNYLVENIDYDLSLSGNFVHTVYGSLVENYAVCDGYSYAAQYLLDGLGIDNLVCAGFAYNPSKNQEEGHMWSYVKLYGHWYGLDVTWNDPIISFPNRYTQSQLEEFKVRYLLKGWDPSSQQGFYFMEGDTSERVVQNYQIYFAYKDNPDEKFYYELPYPEIETCDYADPSVSISEERQKDGDQTVSLNIILTTDNMLDNMIIAYKYSKDNGQSFGDYVICDNVVSFDEAEANGTYNFYILTNDGKTVKDCGSVTVNIGVKYDLVLNSIEGVEYEIIPNGRTQFYTNDYVTITFTSFPIGKELDFVSSEQVEIQLNGYSCNFTFPSENVYINVNLKDKLYNIETTDIEGLELSLSSNQAKWGDQVTLMVTQLPIGKTINGIFLNDQFYVIELNKPFEFEMPAEDIVLSFSLEDIKYKLDIINDEMLDYEASDTAIYKQEIIISVENLPIDKKIVIDSDILLDVKYISNKQISFSMPASDLEIILYTQLLELHNLVVDIDSEIDYNLNLNQAYFGQTVILSIENLPEDYKIISVKINEETILPSDEYEYSFMMPDEQANVDIVSYKTPEITITNELNYTIEFITNNDGYYYQLNITNLPENKYIKGWTVLDLEGNQIDCITQRSATSFMIKLDDKDLIITFELDEKNTLDDNAGQEPDLLLLSLVFIGMVAIIGIISYMIYKNKE